MDFDHYDPDLATLITAGSSGGGGLPDYLGIRTTHVEIVNGKKGVKRQISSRPVGTGWSPC